MKFNTELSQAAIDQIKKYPELFDQENWGRKTDCGTAHCWYGWCLALSGFDNPDIYKDHTQLQNLAPEIIGMEWYSPNFERISGPGNTLEDLEYYHTKLAKGESIQFDLCGFDVDGYDGAGYDSEGFDNMGYDRQGYDSEGFDERGYNFEGLDNMGYLI